MARAWALVAVAASTLLVLPAPAHAARQSRPARLVTITIPDPQGYIPPGWLPYPGQPRADVLLPAGYDPHRRYPLVLNLGGLGGDYARAAFGPGFVVDAIVVTPEPGNGWYADWWNDGERGAPAWESYYLDDVLPTVLDRYPIRPQRRWHAIIGISMGGLGAAYLGGRLPGFFGTVASLSGFVDPQFFGLLTDEAMGLVSFAPAHHDDDLYAVYGPPDGFYATGHNPARLVANLAQTRVFESTGTGVPNSPSDVPVGSALEGLIIFQMNELFHRAAVAAGVDVTYQVHPGGHDAASFSKEIDAMLAWGLFKPVPEHPASWTNQTVAASGQLWDVGYRFSRPPTQLVQFRRSGDRLSISKAGAKVSITTTGGCTIRAATPATIEITTHGCRLLGAGLGTSTS